MHPRFRRFLALRGRDGSYWSLILGCGAVFAILAIQYRCTHA